MMSLDDEISSLQKENNHSDSQLHRIKADVAGMETEANGEDKVSGEKFRWELGSVKTKIKHFYCFRRVLRLKDEMPNFQIIMKTSELMYSQSWVS